MPLRTTEMKVKYAENMSQYEDFSGTKNFDEDKEESSTLILIGILLRICFRTIKIAQTHDMLVPKRTFGKMSECNKDEWDESKQLSLNSRQMPTMMQFLENFSRNRSVSKHLHLHLLVWKEE